MSADATVLRESLQDGSRRAFRRGSEIMFRASQTRVPERTGRLASSGKLVDESETSDEFQQTLIYDATNSYATPYASFTDQDTRPHQILPRKAGGVLVFQVGGKTVFARSVQHPGTKGTRWFSGVVTDNAWGTAMQVVLDQTTFP